MICAHGYQYGSWVVNIFINLNNNFQYPFFHYYSNDDQNSLHRYFDYFLDMYSCGTCSISSLAVWLSSSSCNCRFAVAWMGLRLGDWVRSDVKFIIAVATRIIPIPNAINIPAYLFPNNSSLRLRHCRIFENTSSCHTLYVDGSNARNLRGKLVTRLPRQWTRPKCKTKIQQTNNIPLHITNTFFIAPTQID